MTERERLIEILLDGVTFTDQYKNTARMQAEHTADRLLANGVIVPPCNVGQDIWHITKHYDGRIEMRKGKVSMLQQKADKSWKVRITVNSSVWDFTPNEIGIRYFLSREDAEKALKERSEGK